MLVGPGRWERQGHIAKVLDREPRVHAGGLGAAMAEQISDALKRGAPPEQVNGEGVPQAMCALGKQCRDRFFETTLGMPRSPPWA